MPQDGRCEAFWRVATLARVSAAVAIVRDEIAHRFRLRCHAAMKANAALQGKPDLFHLFIAYTR